MILSAYGRRAGAQVSLPHSFAAGGDPRPSSHVRRVTLIAPQLNEALEVIEFLAGETAPVWGLGPP